MMIQCFVCSRELEGKGGILLSPPSNLVHPSLNQSDTIGLDNVFKYHLCQDCYWQTMVFINTLREKFKNK